MDRGRKERIERAPVGGITQFAPVVVSQTGGLSWAGLEIREIGLERDRRVVPPGAVSGLVNRTGVGYSAWSMNGFGFVPGQSGRYG